MTHSTKDHKFSSPLKEPLYRFLESKRAVGYKYREEERCLFILDKFLKTVLPEENPAINCKIVRQYIARWGKENDTTRTHRLSLLRQFCIFLAFEQFHTFVPPKGFMGIKRCSFTPRLLTRIENKRFVEVCRVFPGTYNSPLRGAVFGTALLILFLAGLRAGEVLRLTVKDIDFCSGTLHVLNTKFGKSRYVPMSDDMQDHLLLCKDQIERRLGARKPHEPFFCTSRGKPYSIAALRNAFHQVCARAGIVRSDKKNRLRMHDLRHNAAVLRMFLWYEEGADLEANLPLLATYLGHKNLISTQKYLHLTKELLIPIVTRYQERFGHIIDDGGMP